MLSRVVSKSLMFFASYTIDVIKISKVDSFT